MSHQFKVGDRVKYFVTQEGKEIFGRVVDIDLSRSDRNVVIWEGKYNQYGRLNYLDKHLVPVVPLSPFHQSVQDWITANQSPE